MVSRVIRSIVKCGDRTWRVSGCIGVYIYICCTRRKARKEYKKAAKRFGGIQL